MDEQRLRRLEGSAIHLTRDLAIQQLAAAASASLGIGSMPAELVRYAVVMVRGTGVVVDGGSPLLLSNNALGCLKRGRREPAWPTRLSD
jgi:hypothetical protein